MSFRASHWAVHEVRGLRPVERILLLVLSEYADDRDCAWPSQETLADDVETSVSTLRRSLRRLESLGLITREHRWVMDENGDTHRASNVYRLHVGATPDWGAVGGQGDGPSRRVQNGADVPAEGPGADDTPIPVKVTDIGAGGTKVPVDNSGSGSVSVGSADTGQDDRYRGATRPYRSKQGGIPVTQVTGISTPNHQVEPPDLTGPDEVTSPTHAVTGAVGSGRVMGPSSEESAVAAPAADRPLPRSRAGCDAARGRPGLAPGLSEPDRLLLAECLPERLRALDAAGARRVVGLLEERVVAGWRPDQIRRLMDQPLPPRVGRLSSLVASRLERNVDPGAAPLPAGAVARLSDEARQERARRRSEELAVVPGRRPGDGVMDRAMAQVRREAPEAGRAEQVRLAADLVRSWQEDAAGRSAEGQGVAS